MDAIRKAVKGVADKVVTVRTGTVESNNASASKTRVVLDNDTTGTPVAALSVAGPLAKGVRVSCVAHPAGLLVLGPLEATHSLAELGAHFIAPGNYVPTLTQGATITKTPEFAVYARTNGWAYAQVSLSVGSAGTAANQIIVGLPPLVPTSYRNLGSGAVFDASTGLWYNGVAVYQSATTCTIIPNAANTGLGQSSFTAALASGDLVMLNLAYRTSS